MDRADLKEFYAKTKSARKIIVVDLGFLGDVVHLAPMFWEIKRHYAQAELHVLTSPLGTEVLKMLPCVDRAWAFPLGPPSPPWWKHWGVVRALRREKFDVAFNFNGNDRPLLLTALLGAKQTLVYLGGRQHFWQGWIIKHRLPRMKLPVPVYEGQRHLLPFIGFTLEPARFDFQIPAADRQWATEQIPLGAIHISLSASFALKEWPMKNNLGLVRYLLKNCDRPIVVTAAPNAREQQRLAELNREIKDEHLHLVSEKLPISRIAAVLQRCAIHVGPDSGMINLASALGIPVVGIFREYNDMAAFQFPGPENFYFAKPCPCHNSKSPPCAATNEAACLVQIEPELVGAEICRRLQAAPAAR